MQAFWNREWQQLRKRGLVWLLLWSCVALIMVMADQARTLEQQRTLIQVLQGDSQQLFAGRVQDLVNGHKPQDHASSVPNTAPQSHQTPPPAAAAPPPTPDDSFQPVTDPARVLRSI